MMKPSSELKFRPRAYQEQSRSFDELIQDLKAIARKLSDQNILKIAFELETRFISLLDSSKENIPFPTKSSNNESSSDAFPNIINARIDESNTHKKLQIMTNLHAKNKEIEALQNELLALKRQKKEIFDYQTLVDQCNCLERSMTLFSIKCEKYQEKVKISEEKKSGKHSSEDKSSKIRK
jgi:hypothetical protein